MAGFCEGCGEVFLDMAEGDACPVCSEQLDDEQGVLIPGERDYHRQDED